MTSSVSGQIPSYGLNSKSTFNMGSNNLSPPGERQLGTMHEIGCRITWIEEMIPPDLTFPERKQLFNVPPLDTLQDDEDALVSSWKMTNTRLMWAAASAHISDYKEALLWISAAEECFQGATFLQDEHRSAYRYLIDANAMLIKKAMAMCVETGVKVPDNFNEILQSLPIACDVEDGVFQAAICVSKGMLSYLFHECQENNRTPVYYFKRATELDCKAAEWFVRLYRGIRNQRRRRQPGSPPIKEEIKAITEAYRLEPDGPLTLCNYASMMDDQLKGRRDLNEHDRTKLADEVVVFMIKAKEKNPDYKFPHVRLAEIYGYGDYSHFDHKLGEAYFQECEERWPNSSKVLHKFGKYYDICGNWKKALEYFARGLDAKLSNFPCLMDYLKCLSKNDNGDNQILDVINRCISVHAYAFDRLELTNLLLAKGLVLLRMDTDGTMKREASGLWVEAAVKNFTGSKRIGETIYRGHWKGLGTYEINIKELIDILNQMLILPDINEDNIRKRAIMKLINDLQINENWRAVPCNLYTQSPSPPRIRLSSVCSVSSTSSADSFVTAKSFWSIGTSILPSSPYEGSWRNESAPKPLGIYSTSNEYHPKEIYETVVNNSIPPPPNPSRRDRTRKPAKKSAADIDNDWRH